MVPWRKLAQHCLFTTFIHSSLQCSSRSGSVNADAASEYSSRPLAFPVICWSMTHRQLHNHPPLHNYTINSRITSWIFESKRWESRRLICAVSLQKTAAALWNINTWNKQNKKIWACCWSVLGFSCISVRILFFLPAAAYELYVALPHHDIKSLDSHHIWSNTSSFRLHVVFSEVQSQRLPFTD